MPILSPQITRAGKLIDKAASGVAKSRQQTQVEFGFVVAASGVDNTMTIQTPIGQRNVDLVHDGSMDSWDRYVPASGTKVSLAIDPINRNYFPIRYHPKLQLITTANDPSPMADQPTTGYGKMLEVPSAGGVGTGQAVYTGGYPTCRRIYQGEYDRQSKGYANAFLSRRGMHSVGVGPLRTVYSLDMKRIQSAAPLHTQTIIGHTRGLIGDEIRFGSVMRPHLMLGPIKEVPVRDYGMFGSKTGGFGKEYLRVIKNAWSADAKLDEPVPFWLSDVREGNVVDDLGFPIYCLASGAPYRRLAKYYDLKGTPLTMGVDVLGNFFFDQLLNTEATLGVSGYLKSLFVYIEKMFDIYMQNPLLTFNGQGLANAMALRMVKYHTHPVVGQQATASAELQSMLGGTHTTSISDVL